jgi:hypothetical protein
LGRRLDGRGGPNDHLDNVLPEAVALDRANLRDVVVDTSGRTVADVLRTVRYLTGGWPDLTARPVPPASPRPATSPSDDPDRTRVRCCGCAA